MNWDERSLEAGESRFINGNESITTHGDQVHCELLARAFAAGAKWQREELCADEAVNRTAGFLYHQDFSSPMSEHSSWCTNPTCDLIDGYRIDARHLINALIGEG